MKQLGKRWEVLIITGLFLILAIIFLFPLLQGLILLPLDMLVSNYTPWYIPGQILVKNPYMQDSIIQMYPWKHLVFQSLSQGIIPYWNPYQFMGMPFLASLKPMIFYPLNILYLLGEIPAWNMLLFLQVFLSLTFMYILARSFKLSVFASILSSFVFSLNTLMIGVMEFGSEGHVLLWLPLFIFCAKKYLEEQKGRYLVLLGFAYAWSIFAGQLQYTGYATLLLVGFIIFYGRSLKTKLSTYLFIFVSLFLGGGMSAVQLLPSLELFAHSLRGIANSHDVFINGLNRPYQVFRLLSPDFFGNPTSRDLSIGYIESIGYFGIVPLFFSIYAMLFARKNSVVTFFTWSFILATALSIQGIGQVLYVLHIPLVTSGEGDRIFSLVYISAAVLSGFGLMEFLSEKTKKKNILSLITFLLFYMFVVAGTILIVHGHTNIGQSFLHNMRFSMYIISGFFVITCFFILLKKNTIFISTLFLLLICSITYFDLFRMGYRFLTFSNQKFFYPQMKVTKFIQDTSKMTLARNIGLAEPELPTYLNVYSIETYNPLYILRNAQLMQALQGKLDEPLPQNKYLITKGESLKYALDFLGVSQIVVDKDTNPTTLFFTTDKFQNYLTPIYKDDRYAVFANTTAYPRFGLFYNKIVEKDDKKILEMIAHRTVDLQHKIILNEAPPIRLEEGTGSATLITSSLNSEQFFIKTDKPALFYISDTFFPGWSATVNKKEAKIYQANYTFRAVLVPAGISTLVFSYMPSTFIFGIWISIVSGMGLIAFAFFHARIYGFVVKKLT